MLGRRLGDLLEPAQLAVDLRADLLGQVELLQRRAQLVDLRLRRVLLAELVLDRLHLLAQDPLALALLHLGVDLALDLRADGDDVELAREDLAQAEQALADVDLLEQRLALLAADPQRAGDQVAERRRVLEVDDRHLQLLGEVRDLLDDLAERLLDVAHQGRQLRALLDDVGQLAHARGQVRVGPGPLLHLHALAALDEDAQRAVGHLEHAGDGAGHADVVELLRVGRVDLGLLAGEHHEHPVADQHVVDEPDRAVLADGERGQRVGEGDRVAQREDGQLGGQRRVRLGRLALGAEDLDHSPSMRCWIGTRRASDGVASGSSTVRIPSS